MLGMIKRKIKADDVPKEIKREIIIDFLDHLENVKCYDLYNANMIVAKDEALLTNNELTSEYLDIPKLDEVK